MTETNCEKCNSNGNCGCSENNNQIFWRDLPLPEDSYDPSEFIMDESGGVIGTTTTTNKFILGYLHEKNISYKYAEDRIIEDLKNYVDKTYTEHYMTKTKSIECFDAWIALGDSTPTFRNTAIKYLWRYGKKSGSNKKDLMKALHYVMMCLYVDHYKDEK